MHSKYCKLILNVCFLYEKARLSNHTTFNPLAFRVAGPLSFSAVIHKKLESASEEMVL
jgi:hypothetical protein